jgi:hypothetical protein
MNEDLGGKIDTFCCIMQQEVLCDKIIRLEHISKTVVSVVILLLLCPVIISWTVCFFSSCY